MRSYRIFSPDEKSIGLLGKNDRYICYRFRMCLFAMMYVDWKLKLKALFQTVSALLQLYSLHLMVIEEIS